MFWYYILTCARQKQEAQEAAWLKHEPLEWQAQEMGVDTGGRLPRWVYGKSRNVWGNKLREAKIQNRIKVSINIQCMKKSFYRFISSKKRTKESWPITSRGRTIVRWSWHKDTFNTFFNKFSFKGLKLSTSWTMNSSMIYLLSDWLRLMNSGLGCWECSTTSLEFGWGMHFYRRSPNQLCLMCSGFLSRQA